MTTISGDATAISDTDDWDFGAAKERQKEQQATTATTATTTKSSDTTSTRRWEKKSSPCGRHQTVHNIVAEAFILLKCAFAVSLPFVSMFAAAVFVTLVSAPPVIVLVAMIGGLILGAVGSANLVDWKPKWMEFSDASMYANPDQVHQMARRFESEGSFQRALTHFFQRHPVETLERYGFLSSVNAQELRRLIDGTEANRKVVEHFEREHCDAIRKRDSNDNNRNLNANPDYSYLEPYDRAKEALESFNADLESIHDNLLRERNNILCEGRQHFSGAQSILDIDVQVVEDLISRDNALPSETAQKFQRLIDDKENNRKLVEYFERHHGNAIRKRDSNDNNDNLNANPDYSYLAPYDRAKEALKGVDAEWKALRDAILRDWPNPEIRV